jgi:hypothetical protein
VSKLARVNARVLFAIKRTATRALEWLFTHDNELDQLFDVIVRDGCGGCPHLSLDGECSRIPMPLPCQMYMEGGYKH